MTDYTKLVEALRCKSLSKRCDSCGYGYHLSPDSECNDACHVEQIYADAAAAIEELQAVLKEADKKQEYQHGCICELTAENEEHKAEIEALQAEVQSYKALANECKASAENKERLLRLYRAEQAKYFYSAIDDNGRIKATPCACLNIPVFPDSSESPNS